MSDLPNPQPELTVMDGELFIRASALGPLVQLDEVRLTCSACPLQFEGRARTAGGEARPVYFRLRHGSWYLEYEDDEYTIACGVKGMEGTATFEEVQLMLLRFNVHLPDTQRWA